MNKLGVLLTKEIKNLLTRQVLVSVIMVMVIFFAIGKAVGSSFSDESGSLPELPAVPDYALSDTDSFVDFLKQSGFPAFGEDEFSSLSLSSVVNEASPVAVVFYDNFIEDFSSGKKPVLKIYTYLNSGGGVTGLTKIEISSSRIEKNLTDNLRAAIAATYDSDDKDIFELYRYPVEKEEHVVKGDREVKLSLSQVAPYVINQTVMLAFLLFIATLTGAQLVATSVATEKESKTLETLLSLPVKRYQIVLAKMLAAAIVSVLLVVFYFAGFSFYMQSITSVQQTAGTSQGLDTMLALKMLGLELPIWSNALRVTSYILSLLNALGIALILGLFAEDTKSVQLVITPIMLVLLSLYLITILTSFSGLPIVLRLILLLFPFTHSFISTPLLIDGNFGQVAGGIIYQAIFLIIMALIAVKIFESDKILTLKLGKKKWQAAKN